MLLRYINVDPAAPCLYNIFMSGYYLKIFMRIKPILFGSFAGSYSIIFYSSSVKLARGPPGIAAANLYNSV